jgi:hypothetical protein
VTKERLLGLLGVLWGGGILVAGLTRDAVEATAGPAYATGQTMGLVLGALLFFVGLYYLITG